MPEFESERFDKGKNIAQKYIEWTFSGRYIRFIKILYTSLWVTALVTFQFGRFIELIFLGFLGREVLLLLFKKDYREDSYLIKLAKMTD